MEIKNPAVSLVIDPRSIKPERGYLLVRPIRPQATTSNGLHLPTHAVEQMQEPVAEVVALGPWFEEGAPEDWHRPRIDLGSVVLLRNGAGQLINSHSEDGRVLIIDATEIKAVLELAD